ncbi:hypothetical protein [Xylophilus ampelinus]|uniref:Uncharacterized protein n=1 Tax=Xylophilus ampelinus TaxID=54067 RepID=A0A318SK87_9BURK|nr:hypothetical protein [Xylophilus ampelinus]MCS4510848.1 hypothetical protein [Xylophilus ampelinus]PYE76171.1 hypothetical protein DFQ15_11538 [Xylophilus ampelinus]
MKNSELSGYSSYYYDPSTTQNEQSSTGRASSSSSRQYPESNVSEWLRSNSFRAPTAADNWSRETARTSSAQSDSESDVEDTTQRLGELSTLSGGSFTRSDSRFSTMADLGSRRLRFEDAPTVYEPSSIRELSSGSGVAPSYSDLGRQQRINKAAKMTLEYMNSDANMRSSMSAMMQRGEVPAVARQTYRIPSEDYASVISTVTAMDNENKRAARAARGSVFSKFWGS